MRAHHLVREVFDRPYPVKVFKDQAVARDERGKPLWIVFDRTPTWETVKVTFDRGKGYELTDWGNEFKIFATVVSAIEQWSARYRPDALYFSVENDEPNNRQRLYDRMVKKLAGSTDYQLVIDPAQIGSDTVRYYAGLLGRRFSDARYWWLVRRDLFKPRTDDAGQSESVEEGWRDVARAAALGTAVAAGGAAVYDQMKSARPVSVTATPADKPFAVPRVTGSPLESFLARAAHAAGMRGTELAQFLAQAAHETGDFQHMRELGASRYFDRYEPRMVRMKKTGEIINANPRAQRLGNDQPGDGARYRGRGFLQITGRDNYRRLGAALNLPLEEKPELLEQPEIAARAALWFWKNRVVPRVQDFADTHAATRAINPALRGLEDRRAKFVEYVKQLRTDTNEATRAVIYTHPDTLGASLNDPGEHDEPVVMLPVSRIQVLEPDSKFADPKYSKNLKRIQQALQSGQQLPPISVRKLGQGYQVIDGHHRFKAYRLAGATKVPARIVKPENIRVTDQPWSKNLPPVAESQRHDQEWVDAVDRHVRLRAMAKREGDEAKFNYHNDAIKKLYGHDNPPVTPAGTFNDDPGGIEIDETLADGRNELYHGTLVKNVQSILANGLNPTVGEFTKSIYKNKAKPLVFAADLKGSRAVYCALSSQIGMLLGHFPVSAQDIAQHGAILVISKDVNKFKQYTSNRRQGSKEPTDYTSQETISIDRVIKGKDLLQWIKTHNADWGEMECPIEEHTEINENFADGKVKGKSRPGRVKRAGASCAGSVTDLRQRAAKYGGERGRMYHWCANMKSGRKKK